MSSTQPSPESLQQQVDGIRWFHRIDLGDGVVTPGLDDTPAKLRRIQLPADLTGKSILDIGAWDGFFSFEAEKRGAKRVTAVDSYCWSDESWAGKSGFDLARRQLNSQVEDRFMEVEQISAAELGGYDVVLFLGVLYHLRHPLLALEKLAEVTDDLLILETKVDLLHAKIPAMAFYQDRELNRDPTNWWAPNILGLEHMLRSVGFGHFEVVSRPKPLWSRLLRKPTQPGQWWREVQQGRVTIHARKKGY